MSKSFAVGIIMSLLVFIGIGHAEQTKPKYVVGKPLNEALLGLRNEFSNLSPEQSQKVSKHGDSTVRRTYPEVSHD